MADANFIPIGRLSRKRRRARLYLWAVVCAAYGLALASVSGAAYVFYLRDDRAVAQQVAATAGQVETDNEMIVQLRRTLAHEVTTLETTRAMYEQPDWGKLLIGLSKELDRQLVLTRCRLVTIAGQTALADQVRPALATKPLDVLLKERSYRLTLNGYGKAQESVSQFVLRLEATGVFDVVRLVSSSRQTFLGGEAVAFVVECHF